MRKFISDWFSKLMADPTSPSTMDERNKQLLKNELLNCFTVDEVRQLKDLMFLYAKAFTPQELIDFNLDCTFRIALIEYSESKFPQPYYATHEIAAFFSRAKSAMICEAIMLHIRKNIRAYLMRRSDIFIYISMNDKRQNELMNQMFTASA